MSSPPAVLATSRRQFAIGVAALVGLYGVVFGTAVVNSVRAVAGVAALDGPSAAAAVWSDRVATVEGDVLVVVLVLAVVLRWLPTRAPDLARSLRLGRPGPAVPGGLTGAATAYVGVAVASAWSGDRLVAALGLPSDSYPGVGRGAGALVTGAIAGTAAGVTEELVLVALAVAVFEYRATVLGRRPRWLVPATIALLLALRWLVHLYYLWGSLFVLLWVPAAYALYRWAGSVWPLVLGHATYDCLLAVAHAYPALRPAIDRGLWLLAAAAAAMVAAGLARHALAGRSDADGAVTAA